MASPGYFIDMVTEKKGRGLFAIKDYNVGDVIFTEEPLISCQFSWNKLYGYLACDYCMKSLETAEEMARRLCNDDSVSLPHPECCQNKQLTPIACEKCGVKYCTFNCLNRASKEYHRLLCLNDQNPHKQSLIDLEESWRQAHYPPETSSIMLIIKLIAKIKQSSQKEQILEDINRFCNKTANDKMVHKLLGDKFEDKIEYFRKTISGFFYEKQVEDWFTPHGFKSLLALLGTNQQGVGSSSLSLWVRNCDDLESEKDSLDSFIDQLYEKMEEFSGDFLNCEGVGLYRLQSACNHSCDPDAEIAFENGNHTLSLKSLKSVCSGQEIHISYLDECALRRSRHSRHKVLAENYLFECQCLRCEDQADDPDVTSDEEEGEDSNEEK